jgi:hypothetical protein
MLSVAKFRVGAAALLATVSLVLTGCFMSPGTFVSELVVDDRGRFSFTYDGEIYFATFAQIAELEKQYYEFSPYCYDEESYEERTCSEAEVAEQREAREEQDRYRRAEDKRKQQQFSKLLGGIDPSEPDAPQKLAAMLERQSGWESVEHIEGGLFRVRYATSGTLDHDFMFPMIEDVPAINPFVQTVRRKDGRVRITAPAFNPANLQELTAAVFAERGPTLGMASFSRDFPGMPFPQGSFKIRTKGKVKVVTNNTDEGPERAAGGEVLNWKIVPYRWQAPTAIIALGR